MTLGAKIQKIDRQVMRKVYKDAGLVRDAMTQLETALDEDEGYVNGVPWNFCSLGFDDYVAAGGAAEEDLLFPGTGMINVRGPDHRDEEGGSEGWQAMQKTAVMAFREHRHTVTAKTTLKNLEVTEEEVDHGVSATSVLQDISIPGATALKAGAPTWLEKASELASNVLGLYSASGGRMRGEDLCGGCGATKSKDGSPLILCGRCRKRRYCARECQKKNWPTHKKCVLHMDK